MIARRVAEVSAILAVLGTLVSCSGITEKKEYDVPRSLCGISVDRALVSKLLPPGGKADVQEKNPVPSRKRCQVNVDGKVALVASQEWWEQGDSITDAAEANPQVESAELTDDGNYLYSGTGGVGRARSCSSPDHPGHVLYTAMQVYASGQEDASAMKKLIITYTKAVERSNECR